MDFYALALECAPWVAPQTMAAIVKTESEFKPFAININGGAKLERQPATKEEAIVTSKWLLANNYNIDLGLGQVNSVNLPKTNLSVEDAFDPCKNLAASASILQQNFTSASKRTSDEQAALQAAISAYNTGSFTKGFSNGYVQKVINNTRLVSEAETTQLAVSPIPLAKSGKANSVTNSKLSTVKLTNVSVKSNAPVKLKAVKPEPEQNLVEVQPEDNETDQTSIYATRNKTRDIMVY